MLKHNNLIKRQKTIFNSTVNKLEIIIVDKSCAIVFAHLNSVHNKTIDFINNIDTVDLE